MHCGGRAHTNSTFKKTVGSELSCRLELGHSWRLGGAPPSSIIYISLHFLQLWETRLSHLCIVRQKASVTAHISTWRCQKSTGVANVINGGSVPFMCPSKSWQWGSIDSTTTLKLELLEGIQPLLIVSCTPVLKGCLIGEGELCHFSSLCNIIKMCVKLKCCKLLFRY